MLLDIHLFDRASHADVVDGEFICIRGCSVGGANLRLWVALNLKLSIYSGLSGVYILACRAPARLLSLRGRMSEKQLLIASTCRQYSSNECTVVSAATNPRQTRYHRTSPVVR